MLTIVLSALSDRVTLPVLAMLLGGISFSGWIFGAVIAAYFYFILQRRTILGVMGFVLTCTVAYFSSVSMVRAAPFVPLFFPLFFLAGTVGAYLVLVAAFICFSEEESPFIRALPWSFLGGAFGAIGSLAGILFLPYSVWVAWQTGMGSVIGYVFSGEEVSAEIPADSAIPVSTRRNLLITKICLVAVAALALAMVVRKEYPQAHKEALRSTTLARSKAKRPSVKPPSLDNLPEVQKLPPDQALFLGELGGYVTEGLVSGPSSSVNPPSPLAQFYEVTYHSPKASPDETYPPGPFVVVKMEEYPNESWAAFELVQEAADIDWNNPERVKFGNRIYGVSYSLEAGFGGKYCWTSGNRLLSVHFYGLDPDAVLQAYLQKYPPSKPDGKP